jgi:hypothetical protein
VNGDMNKTRYEILDGLRGYFLVFMLLNHLIFSGDLMLRHFNHAELGYVQDAQGFVFLSGLIIGLLYTRMAARGGLWPIWEKARSRALDLVIYNSIVIGIVIALALVLPHTRTFWFHMLGIYDQPAVRSISALLMLYQPTFMDILPQYILYIIVSPFLVWAVMRGRWIEVMGGSLVLWFVVQVGLPISVVHHIEQLVGAGAPGFKLRTAFNPLAWQIVFVSGLVIGAMVQAGKVDLKRVFPAHRTGPLWLCLGLMALFAYYRLGTNWHFLPEALARRATAMDVRNELSLIYLVNFVATGYAIAWLMISGAEASSRIARGFGHGLRTLFAWRFLNFIGKHSLQVYAYHVVLVYLVVWGDWAWGPFDQATKTALTLALVSSLWIPAKIHEWYVASKARAAAPKPALASSKAGGPTG